MDKFDRMKKRVDDYYRLSPIVGNTEMNNGRRGREMEALKEKHRLEIEEERKNLKVQRT